MENPKNWSKAYKWYITAVIAFSCFVVAFASAVVTAGLDGPAKEFHVSLEVSLLTITVFVVGFGVGKFLGPSSPLADIQILTLSSLGPMVFAPLSEVVGRKPVYVVTLFIALIFEIPCAVAPNIGTLLV